MPFPLLCDALLTAMAVLVICMYTMANMCTMDTMPKSDQRYSTNVSVCTYQVVKFKPCSYK